MDFERIIGILGVVIGALGVIAAIIFGIWQIYLWYKDRRKDQNLVDAFALGYSLIGAAAAGDPVQKDACMVAFNEAAGKLDIKTSATVKHATSIEDLLTDGKALPLLRNQTRRKHGIKASQAFEMGIWLTVGALAKNQQQQRAIAHAECLARRIGLDEAYINRTFIEAGKISEKSEFAYKISDVVKEMLDRLEALQEELAR